MSLLRAAGRTMLASFFVVQGAKTAMKPDEFVSDAKPVAEKLVPLVKRVAPPQVSPFIPNDTKQLVRYSGAAQVVAGLGLATGIARRPSSSLLAVTMVPHVMASRAGKNASPEQRTAARATLLRNVALLGATIIAAEDTQGKPSIAWLASRQGRKLQKAITHEQGHVSKVVSEKGSQLEKSTRKQRKALKKQGKQWAKDAKKQGKQLQKDAAKQQKSLAKSAKKQNKVIGKRASQLTDKASDKAGSTLNDLVSQLESALS